MSKPLRIKTLIVDDEAHIRQKVKKIIESQFEDFEIVTLAKDGHEALEIIKNNRIDLLITDIQMPEMTGLELVENIHVNYPHIKALILTGFGEFEYAKKAIQLDVVDFILKPLNKEDFIKILAELLMAFSIEWNQDIHLPSNVFLSGEETFEMVRQYIQENYLENITLSEIAEKFNITQAYITKLFIKYTTAPPLKYKTNLRMNKAKDYLSTTDYSMAQIAEALGYSDQFSFSKAFKKNEGSSPLKYRQLN